MLIGTEDYYCMCMHDRLPSKALGSGSHDLFKILENKRQYIENGTRHWTDIVTMKDNKKLYVA